MSKVKKNVFQEFMQDDYVPQNNEHIVKYVAGRGNNLHEVEDVNETHYLVSMPKKFRQTVWLKKNDCIVIDPITEGKKVRGEIICLIPLKNVLQLIQSGEWRPKAEDNFEKEVYVKFLQKHLDVRPDSNVSNTSLASSEDETDEESASEDDENSEENDSSSSEDELQTVTTASGEKAQSGSNNQTAKESSP